MNLEEATQEQLDALEAKVSELEKYKSDSTPQLEAYEKAKVELEEYNTKIKPNWDKTRQTIEALKAVAKEKGVEVDRFERSILLICRRCGVNDLNDTPEISVMHRIDDDVLRSSYKVNTSRGLNAASRLGAFIEQEEERPRAGA